MRGTFMLGAFPCLRAPWRDFPQVEAQVFCGRRSPIAVGWSLLTIKALWPVPSVSMSNEGGKMSEEGETAGRYRQHAARLRLMAEADRDRKTSETLKGIAQSYDLMAQVFEDIDHVNKTEQKRGTWRLVAL